MSTSDIDVGEYHSGMNDGNMESEKDEGNTCELLVLWQAQDARKNGEATTASTVVSATGSSGGVSTFRSAGGSTGNGTGGALRR